MADQKEQDRLISDWGGYPATRDINTDVHVGSAIQKPYAGVEHLLARKRTGYRSFEELKAAVDAAYAEGEDGRNVEEGEDGVIYRWVKGHTGLSVADARGVLQHEVFEERVPVAFSQGDAKAASEAGVRTDFFNGWTWMKSGITRERDASTMAQRPGANPNRRVSFEPASDAEQMRHRAASAAVAANLGIVPIPTTADAPKGEAKSGKEK